MGSVPSRYLPLFVALQLLVLPLMHVMVDHCPEGDCHEERDETPHDECGDCSCPCHQAAAATDNVPVVGLATVTRHSPGTSWLDLPQGYPEPRKPPPKSTLSA